MKINQCQFCASANIHRDRYIGASFWIVLVLTLGVALIGIPWLPVMISCDNCNVQYLAS